MWKSVKSAQVTERVGSTEKSTVGGHLVLPAEVQGSTAPVRNTGTPDMKPFNPQSEPLKRCRNSDEIIMCRECGEWTDACNSCCGSGDICQEEDCDGAA